MSDNGIKKVVHSRVLYPHVIDLKTTVKVLDTADNLEWLLKHFDANIRLNLMTRQREISLPGFKLFYDDLENSALRLIKNIASLNEMPIGQMDDHLDSLAERNTYHPIVQLLEQNKWDGKERLDTFIGTLKAKNPELAKHVLKTWMVAAMEAAHSITGFMNHGVLVLQGPQNIGKTRWVKSLDPIGCKAVKEGMFLDPTHKDSILQLSRYWIAELGELDSIFQKSAIGRLKSFITMEYDIVRAAYARRSALVPRRTVYVATVNDSNYLIDETGNRRWWTLEIEKVDLDHGLDMTQVWAEVYDVWKKGAKPYLENDLQLKVNESNLKHEKIDPLKEQLLAHYDWTHDLRRWQSATQILQEIGYKSPTRSECTRMGTLLKSTNSHESKILRGITLHYVPYFRSSMN